MNYILKLVPQDISLTNINEMLLSKSHVKTTLKENIMKITISFDDGKIVELPSENEIVHTINVKYP